MRFLPVFLDLQTGPVLLIGAGDFSASKTAPAGSGGGRARSLVRNRRPS